MLKKLFTGLVRVSLLASVFHTYGFTLVENTSREELTNRANTIVIGKVTQIESQWNTTKTRIYTFVTISVETYIKGSNNEKTITLKIPGGKVGDIVEMVSDVPVFQKDERVFLFLQSGDFPIVGWYQGKYTIRNDKIAGLKIPLYEFVHEVRTIIQESSPEMPLREKGQSGPAGVPYPASNRRPQSQWDKSIEQEPEKDLGGAIKKVKETEQYASPGWTTIMSEDFEGAFPESQWTLDYNSNSGQAGYGYTWDDDDYKPHSGSRSGWCADANYTGQPDLDSQYDNYPNYLDAWMVYGPFDLSDATDAELLFYYWNESESGYDYFGWTASIDGSQFYGTATSGNSQGWVYKNFDLTDVYTLGNLTGQSEVWIAFIFQSDNIYTYKGAFVDDIVLQKYTNGVNPPNITGISPGSASAGTNNQVTISGSNFGATQGSSTVEFFYRSGQPDKVASIVSWSDNQIVCTVPTRASSGDVTVTTADGNDSHPFTVTFGYLGMKWAGTHPIIDYEINENTSDVTEEGAAVIDGAWEWNITGDANIGMRISGTTSATNESYNGHNEILWGSTSGSIATCYTWYSGGTILESDIVFDDGLNWGHGTSSSFYDVQNIATHELGHLLGVLSDLYGSGDSEKTMYGYGSTNEIKKRSLEPEDIAGIQWIYGVNTNTIPSITVTAPPAGNTDVAQGQTYTIQWIDSDPDDNAYISLAYDTDNNYWNGGHTWITVSLREDPEGSGDTYDWNTSGVSLGTYYIWTMIYDGTNPEAYGVSGGTITIIQPPLPPAPSLVSPINGSTLSTGTVTFDWSDTPGQTDFQLLVDTESGFNEPYTLHIQQSSSASSYTTETPLGDGIYYWKVKVATATGTSDWSDTFSFIIAVPLFTPQNLTATAGNQQVTLRWSPNTEPDLHKYNIYRDTSSPATTLIDSVVASSPPDTFFVDTGLTNGQIYYYRITAVDSAGNESGYSDEASARPDDRPVWSIPDTLTFAEDDSLILDLDTLLTDETDPDSTLSITYSGGVNVSVSVDSTTHIAVFNATLNFNGADTLIFTATDPGGLSSNDTVTVIVTPVNDPPGAFTLIAPADSAEVQTLTPTLSWHLAGNVDEFDTLSYTLYYGNTIPDLTTIPSISDTFYTFAENLLDNTTYYWKVVATDLSGATTENTGGYWSFRVNTVNDLPGDFALVSPENGSMVTDLTPTFYWEVPVDPDDLSRSADHGFAEVIRKKGESAPNSIASIASYHFYLGTDSSFTGVLPDTFTTNSYIPTVDLNEDQEYLWKVVAVDDDGGMKSSEIWSFWTNHENSVPNAFTLIAPANDSEIDTLMPAFSWQRSEDADIGDQVTYSLMLGTNVEDIASVYSGADTTFTDIADLQDNATYYWKVVASDLSGATTENTDGYRTFSTNSVNDPPTVVTLVTPDSVIEVDLTPLFYWTEATDPDPNDTLSYHILWRLMESTSFDSAEVDTNSFVPATPLVDNSEFVWLVNTYDNHGAKSTSDSAVFWTDAYPEPPLPFATIAPADSAEGLATTIEFIWQSTKDPDPLDEVTFTLVYATNWSDSSTYTWIEAGHDTTLSLDLQGNMEYFWLVEAVDKDSLTTGSNDNVPITFIVGTVSIVDESFLPQEFALHQNYPNPFNPVTTVRYDLPEKTYVVLTIYDILGREVRTLVNRVEEPGYKSVVWDGTNSAGQPVSGGLYIYRLQAGIFVKTNKMILLK